jgi:hypothetical protein
MSLHYTDFDHIRSSCPIYHSGIKTLVLRESAKPPRWHLGWKFYVFSSAYVTDEHHTLAERRGEDVSIPLPPERQAARNITQPESKNVIFRTY